MAFADSKTANSKCLDSKFSDSKYLDRKQKIKITYFWKKWEIFKVKSYHFNKISLKIQEYCLKPAFKLLKTVINIKPEEPHKI